MKDIYTSIPINKSSSIVVSQSGCTSHAGLTPDQKRANLVLVYNKLREELQNTKRNDTQTKTRTVQS